MARTFYKNVPFKILIDGNSVEVVAAMKFTSTPYDPGISSGPAEICYPPEGGEIEDVEVETLFYPVKNGESPIDLDGQEWLKDLIVEHVSNDTLLDGLDWDDEP